MLGVDIDSSLRETLEAALERCRGTLADYQAGVLDDDEVRRALFHAGLVVWHDEAWLLDLQVGRWFRYDGLAVGAATAPLSSAGVARIRLAIDDLARELRR